MEKNLVRFPNSLGCAQEGRGTWLRKTWPGQKLIVGEGSTELRPISWIRIKAECVWAFGAAVHWSTRHYMGTALVNACDNV